MPVSPRLVAATAACGLLLTGLCVAASADPIVPGVPTPIDDVFADPSSSASSTASGSPTATASSTASASPTATASSTATASPTATASASATPTVSTSPKPTPVPSGAAVPSGGSIDSEGLFTQPRAKCVQFPDAAGDASTNPLSGAAGDTDDDLDVTGVAYKTTSKALQIFVKETKLDTAPSSAGGFIYDTHSFVTGFTVDSIPVELTAGATGPATAKVAGKASTAMHATAAFDVAHSNVVFTIPRDDLASAVGHSVVGAPATALTAASNADSSFGFPGFEADSAAPAKAEQRTYVIGDNTCFLPAPTTLTIDPTKAVYSDVATIAGALTTADGDAVQGALVTLSLPGQRTMAARTSSEGVASFRFRDTLQEGRWTASMAFAGTSLIGPARGTGLYTVAKETTRIAAAAARGAVIATASDNDGTRIPNHFVTFVANGKRYNVRTDAHGQAVLRRLTKGQQVTVYFASVRSLYYASKAFNAKAG